MVAYTGGLMGLGTMFVSGIPDSDTCGPNPCGFTDTLGPSAECYQFVQCADPTEFSSWLVGKGSLFPSLASETGTEVHNTFGSFLDSVLGLNPTPGSGINWTLLAGIGIAGFVVLLLSERILGR